MRCKCCDSPNTRRWKGEYYCNECRKVIQTLIKEDQDDNIFKGISDDPTALVHTAWDDE